MALVFLIHAEPDGEAVSRIGAALHAAAHQDTWVDDTFAAIAAGPWRLHGADVVVICLSKAATSWIEDLRISLLELGEGGMQFVTLRLEEVASPAVIATTKRVDVFPDEQAFSQGIAWLIDFVAEHAPQTGISRATTVTELAPRQRPREVPDRFLVALSFSGAERDFVRAIAGAVERRMGRSRVFFDEWFEYYIAGDDADVKLQRIYGAGCELAVVCVSATYGSKPWTRAEHRAIRSRLMQAGAEGDPRHPERVLPIRVGEGNVDGILFNTIAPDVRRRTPEQVAELIEDRLHFVMQSAEKAAARVSVSQGAGPSAASPTQRPSAPGVIAPTPAYLNAKVRELSEELERARARKQTLRDAGVATDEVDREILELRRKLRDGEQLRAGDSLGDGRYLLVKPAGRGGFAVVWEAFDRTEQRNVAIKVLHQHLAGDPLRRERFFRGARVMMELKHSAVVRVHDPKGEDDHFCYFVMELIPGGNLREAVLGNHVEAGRRLALILQVGEALAAAHAKRLVHRDVKPSNILLDERGDAKLTDFDLVRGHDSMGSTSAALGTIVYAAPECVHRSEAPTARADVYGLGMTAIFCLVGDDLSLTTFRYPERTIAGLDCSANVKDVLRRAVAWEPEERFADAGEMVAALKKAPAAPEMHEQERDIRGEASAA